LYVPGLEITAAALLPSPLSHVYVPPPEAVTLITGALQSIIVTPVLLVIEAVGDGFTTTCVVAVTAPQFEEIVQVYVPDEAADGFAMIGFC
jgi:hypothetical protein